MVSLLYWDVMLLMFTPQSVREQETENEIAPLAASLVDECVWMVSPDEASPWEVVPLCADITK